jgi:hypothetical protein
MSRKNEREKPLKILNLFVKKEQERRGYIDEKIKIKASTFLILTLQFH